MADSLRLFLGILIWLVIIGIATFIHELGHAVAALILTSGNITIKIGYYERKLICSFSVRRLRMELYPFFPFCGYACWNRPRIDNSINRIIICFGGPFISIVCAVLCLMIRTYGNSDFMRAVGILFIWQAVCTLIPITYPKFIFGYAGQKSDGRNILEVLLKEAKHKEAM